MLLFSVLLIIIAFKPNINVVKLETGTHIETAIESGAQTREKDATNEGVSEKSDSKEDQIKMSKPIRIDDPVFDDMVKMLGCHAKEAQDDFEEECLPATECPEVIKEIFDFARMEALR